MSRGSISALLVVIIAAAALAQSSGSLPTQTPELDKEHQAQLCTVSGRVLTALEGAPIRSARLLLFEDNAKKQRAIFGAITDGEGRFQIKDVPAGRYHLSASRTGFVTQQYQAKGTGAGAVLSMSPAEHVDDVLFRLVRAGVLSGRVVDDVGEPLADVAVSLLRRPTAEEREDWNRARKQHPFVSAGGRRTDDRGEYRIFGLKPGEYYVKISETAGPDPGEGVDDMSGLYDYLFMHQVGTEYAPLYYPGALQISDAQPILLRAGEEAQADFEMRRVKTVEIAGRVIGLEGKPATHAYLLLAVPGVDDWGDLQASTDSKGEFLIKHVSPGTYILTAQQEDESRHEITHQKIEVADSDLKSLTLTFGRGTDIHGQVTREAASLAMDRLGIVLESQSDDEGPSEWAQVKPDGSFLLADVPDGSYTLSLWGLENGWFTKAIHYGSTDVLQKGLQLERGSTSGTMEIVVSSAGAQLEGVVNDQDGKPITGAQLRMRPEPETSFNRSLAHNTGTDQNGHFSFPSVAGGKYKVWARLPSASNELPETNSESQTVTLGDRDHKSLQFKIDIAKDSP